MGASQLTILAIIGTPLLILARDAFNRRRERRQALLALGVLLAILANVAITLYLRRETPGATASGSYPSGGSQKAASAEPHRGRIVPRNPTSRAAPQAHDAACASTETAAVIATPPESAGPRVGPWRAAEPRPLLSPGAAAPAAGVRAATCGPGSTAQRSTPTRSCSAPVPRAHTAAGVENRVSGLLAARG